MEQLIKCNSFSKLEMQVSDAVPSYEYKDSGGGGCMRRERDTVVEYPTLAIGKYQ